MHSTRDKKIVETGPDMGARSGACVARSARSAAAAPDSGAACTPRAHSPWQTPPAAGAPTASKSFIHAMRVIDNIGGMPVICVSGLCTCSSSSLRLPSIATRSSRGCSVSSGSSVSSCTATCRGAARESVVVTVSWACRCQFSPSSLRPVQRSSMSTALYDACGYNRPY